MGPRDRQSPTALALILAELILPSQKLTTSTNHNLNTEYTNSESLVSEESVSPGNWLQKFGPRKSKNKVCNLNKNHILLSFEFRLIFHVKSVVSFSRKIRDLISLFVPINVMLVLV